MSKAFTKETDEVVEPEIDPVVPQTGRPNYITPAGEAKLRAEVKNLLDVERPKMVETVAWAASNGDRSENADYYYGKKRLREIDRRIRFLMSRLANIEIIDPAKRESDQVFFGATITIETESHEKQTYQIVGVDEIDLDKGRISYVSPLGKALLKARAGDEVQFESPKGTTRFKVLSIKYQAIE